MHDRSIKIYNRIYSSTCFTFYWGRVILCRKVSMILYSYSLFPRAYADCLPGRKFVFSYANTISPCLRLSWKNNFTIMSNINKCVFYNYMKLNSIRTPYYKKIFEYPITIFVTYLKLNHERDLTFYALAFPFGGYILWGKHFQHSVRISNRTNLVK